MRRLWKYFRTLRFSCTKSISCTKQKKKHQLQISSTVLFIVFNVTCVNAGYVGYKHWHLHNRVKDINNNPPPLPNTTRPCTGRCLRTCRFEVLKKCRNKQIWLFSARNAFHKSLKAKSPHRSRLQSCESIFIIFAPCYVNSLRQNRFKWSDLHYLRYFLLTIESWLFGNVGFYHSFLPLYTCFSEMTLLIISASFNTVSIISPSFLFPLLVSTVQSIFTLLPLLRKFNYDVIVKTIFSELKTMEH